MLEDLELSRSSIVQSNHREPMRAKKIQQAFGSTQHKFVNGFGQHSEPIKQRSDSNTGIQFGCMS